MAKFDIGDRFGDLLKNVSDSDTTLEKIDINLLDSDERNFYALDGIDELAANIELIGLQQPIRVRANPDMPGRYFIVSGHRRRAALWTLYEEQPEKWGTVPCIVESDTVSPAMQELRLIYANSDTRKMRDADLAKQAERVTELLYQLKEEGVEFPGRMRDHVAEACKVSATKLATLKVISEKLLPPFSGRFASGELSTQAAYALARLSDNAQKLLAENIGKRIVRGSCAEHTLQHETDLLSNHERHKCPNGTTCQNTVGFLLGAAAVQYSWNACEGKKCCLDCYHTESCPGRCQTCRDKQKKTQQQEAAKEARRQKERQQQNAIYKAKTVESAKRLLKAADAAGVADDLELFKKYGYQKFDVKRLRKDASDDFGENASFYGNDYDDLRQYQLVELSKLLHCSTDYLLGLTDELQPAAAAPEAPEWQTGKPTERGWYVIKMETGAGKSFPKAAFYDNFGKTWKFGASGGIIDAELVLGWYKIPEV